MADAGAGWVEVFHSIQVEAETIAGILRARGLDAHVMIEPYLGIYMVPGADEATVYVSEHDATAARSIISHTTYAGRHGRVSKAR